MTLQLELTKVTGISLVTLPLYRTPTSTWRAARRARSSPAGSTNKISSSNATKMMCSISTSTTITSKASIKTRPSESPTSALSDF